MKRNITARAALIRINRQLAKEEQIVKKVRSDSRWHNSTGDYYIIDMRHNSMVATHVSLDTLGKEIGAIADWETVEG